MKREIFRKSALDQISSMDQLDQAMTVIKPANKIALVSFLIIVIVAFVWGFTGSIPDTVTGSGVLINSGEIISIKYSNQGTVKNVFVSAGNTVENGQIIARIERQDLLDGILVQENKLTGLQKLKEVILDTSSDTSSKQELKKQLYNQGLITQAEYSSSIQMEMNLEQQIVELKQQILISREEYKTATQVISHCSGTVIEVPVKRGDFVQPGNTIILVKTDDNDNVSEALVYFPLSEGKKVQPGMKIGVIPSIVKQEEFGYIQGIVTAISEFPVSSYYLISSLQSESLASVFAKNGPLIEAKVSLVPDPSTYSGLKWSSSKGPSHSIGTGLVCTAVVSTSSKKPIELVVPTIKKKLIGIVETNKD
ncbi:MAG: NHLP bacteriocin system secretion protein [Treponema sp.]|nr:NHLP bacteriocin system secretion protein [Treponema sp.]